MQLAKQPTITDEGLNHEKVGRPWDRAIEIEISLSNNLITRRFEIGPCLRQQGDEEEMPATPESDLSLALVHTGDLPSCRPHDTASHFSTAINTLGCGDSVSTCHSFATRSSLYVQSVNRSPEVKVDKKLEYIGSIQKIYCALKLMFIRQTQL